MPTIKVSEEQYNLIVKARKKLAREGINKLPKEIKDTKDIEKLNLGTICGIGASLITKKLQDKNKK